MSVRALLPSLLLLAAALPVAADAQAAGEVDDRTAPGVRGVVVDRETRRPIRDAAVRLAPAGDSTNSTATRAVLTDDEGRFHLAGLEDGIYFLAIQRLGYKAVTDSVAYRADMGLRIEVEMAADALEVEPLLVVTEARSRVLDANGFYERRRRGIGRFVSREEDAVQNALRVSDVFRGMAAVRMSPRGGLGSQGVLLLRGGCVADVFLDGVRTAPPFPVDALLDPRDLEAVEVYTGSEVPPQFGASSCGVVVIWTHVPNPSTGQSFSWTKLLVAVGIFGASLYFW